jgi:glucose-6-phosphate 1-dehydrogenase
VVFKRAPRLAFLGGPSYPDPNHLVLRISPDPGLRLVMLSKASDGKAVRDVHLDLSFAEELGRPPEPYERLIHDALVADYTLFSREGSVEEAWRVLEPLLKEPPEPEPYARGSWGPAGAARLLGRHPAWQLPWLETTDTRRQR